MREDEVQLRSFRVVFDLERRIHKVDRFRIPLPYGLPLRSIAYALASLIAVVAVARFPVVGVVATQAPAPVRFVLLPCAAAWALTGLRVDGRSAHVAGTSVTRFLLSPRRTACWAPARSGPLRLGDLAVVPDERSAAYRAAIVHGPARVLLRGAFAARPRGRSLIVEPDGDGHCVSGKRLVLDRGQRLVLRCARH